MKLLSAAAMRDWDAATLRAQGIDSITLMERAADRCSAWLNSRFGAGTPVVVLCGPGNNGGDGLAIARLLHIAGFGVKAFLLPFRTLSPDCETNLARLRSTDPQLVDILQEGAIIDEMPEGVVIVDALLGAGSDRPVEGWLKDFIGGINALTNYKVAIDLPSGLPADSLPGSGATVLKADSTLTFQQYKRSLLHPESGVFAGKISLMDIDLDATAGEDARSEDSTTAFSEARSLYRPRDPFSHKGTHGTAVLIGGSYGMMGAISLTARAAGRAGAGKVRVLVPECGYEILQTLCPEALCDTSGGRQLDGFGEANNATAFGIGPGMGMNEKTVAAFGQFVRQCRKPLVLDADALNAIAADKSLLTRLPLDTILTPHPKEFERIFGSSQDSMERVELLRRAAMKHRLVIVLKDRYSIVALPDGSCHYNLSGSAALATGGSGDVLCGMITGLLCAGYGAGDAARLGVYMHGVAGEIAAAAYSVEGVVAGDVAEAVGKAFGRMK